MHLEITAKQQQQLLQTKHGVRWWRLLPARPPAAGHTMLHRLRHRRRRWPSLPLSSPNALLELLFSLVKLFEQIIGRRAFPLHRFEILHSTVPCLDAHCSGCVP